MICPVKKLSYAMNVFASLQFMISIISLPVHAIARDDASSSSLRQLSSCGPLEKECAPSEDPFGIYEIYEVECCELTTAGAFVWILFVVAVVCGIVVCSCACCPCCPWHDRLCCARRQEQRNVPRVAASSVKQSPMESAVDVIPVETVVTVEKAPNVVVSHQ